MQPSLFEQLEAENDAKKVLKTRQWKRQENRRYGKRHRRFPAYDPYNPRVLKQRLLELIGTESWVGFIGLASKVHMPAEDVDHMLDKLIKWGYLEEAPLYFRNDAHLFPEFRLEKPDMKNYRGFEFGYRRFESKQPRY